MKIVILGATGKVGKILVQKALSRGMEVKILSRSSEKLEELSQKIEIVKGDYFDKSALEGLITNEDAVLSTIGAPFGKDHKYKPEDYGTAMSNLVEVLEKKGIGRFINITSAGTTYKGEKVSFKRKMIRFMISFIGPVVIPSKEKELAILMRSNLNWTSVRPPSIAEVSGKLTAEETNIGFKVDTNQLADFMLDNIESTEWVRKAPFVHTD